MCEPAGSTCVSAVSVGLVCVPDSPSSVVNKQLGSMTLDEQQGASSPLPSPCHSLCFIFLLFCCFFTPSLHKYYRSLSNLIYLLLSTTWLPPLFPHSINKNSLNILFTSFWIVANELINIRFGSVEFNQ